MIKINFLQIDLNWSKSIKNWFQNLQKLALIVKLRPTTVFKVWEKLVWHIFRQHTSMYFIFTTPKLTLEMSNVLVSLGYQKWRNFYGNLRLKSAALIDYQFWYVYQYCFNLPSKLHWLTIIDVFQYRYFIDFDILIFFNLPCEFHWLMIIDIFNIDILSILILHRYGKY